MDVYSLILYIASSVSMAAIVLQVIMIVSYRLYKKFLFELLLVFYSYSGMLTISMMINYLSFNVKKNEYSEALCTIQGVMIINFELGQYLWATFISYTIYNSVKFNNRKKSRKEFSGIILIPIILAIIFYFLDLIGPAGHFCWIRTLKINTPEQLSKSIYAEYTYYIIIWTLVIINIVISIKLLRFIEAQLNSDPTTIDQLNQYRKNLVLYPMTPLIVLVPCTIKRVVDLYTDIYLPGLELGFTILTTLQGLVFALSYGLNKEMVEYCKPTLLMIFCCQKQTLMKKPRLNRITNHSSLTDSFNFSLSMSGESGDGDYRFEGFDEEDFSPGVMSNKPSKQNKISKDSKQKQDKAMKTEMKTESSSRLTTAFVDDKQEETDHIETKNKRKDKEIFQSAI